MCVTSQASTEPIQEAKPLAPDDNGPMADQATRLFVLFGELLLMLVLMLALRWTFGTGNQHPVPRVPDPDDPTGDGLLQEVSRVPTQTAAEVLRRGSAGPASGPPSATPTAATGCSCSPTTWSRRSWYSASRTAEPGLKTP
jgi:hypothetical protein